MRWRNGLVRDIGNLVQLYSTLQEEKREKKNETKHLACKITIRARTYTAKEVAAAQFLATAWCYNTFKRG